MRCAGFAAEYCGFYCATAIPPRITICFKSESARSSHERSLVICEMVFSPIATILRMRLGFLATRSIAAHLSYVSNARLRYILDKSSRIMVRVIILTLSSRYRNRIRRDPNKHSRKFCSKFCSSRTNVVPSNPFTLIRSREFEMIIRAVIYISNVNS